MAVPGDNSIRDHQLRDWLSFDISNDNATIITLSSAVPELSYRKVQEGIIDSLFLNI
jgi:hypothetical protein